MCKTWSERRSVCPLLISLFHCLLWWFYLNVQKNKTKTTTKTQTCPSQWPPPPEGEMCLLCCSSSTLFNLKSLLPERVPWGTSAHWTLPFSLTGSSNSSSTSLDLPRTHLRSFSSESTSVCVCVFFPSVEELNKPKKSWHLLETLCVKDRVRTMHCAESLLTYN